MIVKIKNTYSLIQEKTINKEFELPNLKEDIENIFKDWENINEDDIYDVIREYIIWNNNDECYESQEDIYNSTDNSNIEILNLDELVKEFSYLIKEEVIELNNCCKNAPSGSNYCPTCGTKLK